MRKAYRVLRGCFPWQQDKDEPSRLVMEGDVIFSDRPLDTMFVNKFERVKLPIPKGAEDVTHQFKPKHPDIQVFHKSDKTYLIFDGDEQHGPITRPTDVGAKLQELIAERKKRAEQREVDRQLLAAGAVS